MTSMSNFAADAEAFGRAIAELRQREDALKSEAAGILDSIDGDTVPPPQGARLAEIVAELKHVDDAKWDLAEKREAEIATAVATAVATAQLRSADIVALCLIADRPYLASEFIRSRLTLADVRADLKARLADEFVEINERVGPPHSVDRGRAALDRAIAAIGQDLREWRH